MALEEYKKFISKTETSISRNEMFDINNDEVEQKELDFSNPEDWQLFLESAEDVYADAMFYEDVAKAEQYKSLTLDDVSGKEIFSTMYQKLQILVNFIAETSKLDLAKEQIADEKIDQMQDLYDELVLLRDHILNIYESEAEIEELEVEEEENKIEVETKTKTKTETETEDEKINESEELPTKEEDNLVIATEIQEETKSEELAEVVVEAEKQEEDLVSQIEDENKEEIEVVEKTESLFDLALPIAGKDGIQHARNLREKLFSARDRDPLLIHDRTKQIAADRLIRFLSTIPKDGFSSEQIVSIQNIAEIIGFTVIRPEVVEIPVEALEKNQPEEESRIFSGHNVTSKVMAIANEDTDSGNVSIRVVSKVPSNKIDSSLSKISEVETVTELEKVPAKTLLPTEKLTTPVISVLEKRDPINKAIHQSLTEVRKTREVLNENSLTAKYLQADYYQKFINHYYNSPVEFEKHLDSLVVEIDARSVDVFEKWLGEKRASPFVFMQDMNLSEISELASSKKAREVLAESNIKYESFVIWVDLIDDMQMIVDADENMTLGELFAVWIIESEIDVAENTKQAA